MIRKAILLRAVLMLTLVNAVMPAELMAGLPRCPMKEQCSCERSVCSRPDDYCSKWFPCSTSQLGCRRCDDYCRKGIPCIPCLPQAHRCNDYCRKCPPSLCPIRMIGCGSGSACSEEKGCGEAGTFNSHR